MSGGLLVAGTTSDAGKSVVAAGIGPWLRRRGVKVAPFEAQNMSNNSAVVVGADGRGGEIGRAQAMQAAACGLAPDQRFNPVLLKPGSDRSSQVVLLGEALPDLPSEAMGGTGTAAHDRRQLPFSPAAPGPSRLRRLRGAASVSGVGAVVEAYADLARRILDRPARLGRTRLVAIDGPSGAGKTVFAGRLARALTAALGAAGGAAPPIVHTDDLLDGWADQFTFWPRLDDWVLSPLRAGRPGRYRRYSWVRRCFTPPWIPVPPAPVVILEGVSTARTVIRPELTLAVFVTAPSPLRRDRALARDGTALLPYLDEWRRGEEAHFSADATATHADLVVDGAPELPHDPTAAYVRLS